MTLVQGYVVVSGEEIDYELRSDGWYVDFNDERGFQKFATSDVSELSVRNNIRLEQGFA